jgi:hypothetical protein
MSTLHLVGIISGNSDGYVSKIEFRTADEAIQFVRNYNRWTLYVSYSKFRAEYYGEIDAETGSYIQ